MVVWFWSAIGPTGESVVPILKGPSPPILDHGLPLVVLDVAGIDLRPKVVPVGYCRGGFLDEGVHVFPQLDALVAGTYGYVADYFSAFLCLISSIQDISHGSEDAEDDEKRDKSLCRHGEERFGKGLFASCGSGCCIARGSG